MFSVSSAIAVSERPRPHSHKQCFGSILWFRTAPRGLEVSSVDFNRKMMMLRAQMKEKYRLPQSLLPTEIGRNIGYRRASSAVADISPSFGHATASIFY
jgi:hypothetical protein